jgi:hypothetical protein
MFDEQEIIPTGQLFDVGSLTGDKVIHSNDGMAFRQKTVTEVGTQETSSTGN